MEERDVRVEAEMSVLCILGLVWLQGDYNRRYGSRRRGMRREEGLY